MNNSFGKIFNFTTWGESHGEAIGCVVDGVPSLIPLCEADIQVFLDKRKPGQSKYTTQRRETDEVKIFSGVFEGKTTGHPISLVIFNQDQRSKDYGDSDPKGTGGVLLVFRKFELMKVTAQRGGSSELEVSSQPSDRSA